MVSEIAWCLCRFPEMWDCSLKEAAHVLLLTVFKVSQPTCFLNIFAKECFLTTSCFHKDRVSMLNGLAGCLFRIHVLETTVRWWALSLPAYPQTKASSCLARGCSSPCSLLQPFLCAVLLVSFFVARMGKGTKSIWKISTSLCILLHLCIPSERSIKCCCSVLLILYILATMSAKQLFSVRTEWHTKYKNTDEYRDKVTILYCIFSVLNTSSLVISEFH